MMDEYGITEKEKRMKLWRKVFVFVKAVREYEKEKRESEESTGKVV